MRRAAPPLRDPRFAPELTFRVLAGFQVEIRCALDRHSAGIQDDFVSVFVLDPDCACLVAQLDRFPIRRRDQDRFRFVIEK
jgi:hypothetical protein